MGRLSIHKSKCGRPREPNKAGYSLLPFRFLHMKKGIIPDQICILNGKEEGGTADEPNAKLKKNVFQTNSLVRLLHI